MGLRRAISALPDDRETASAVREVIAFLSAHASEPLSIDRIAKATGLGSGAVEQIVRVLTEFRVLDFDGESGGGPYRFSPDSVLELEVRRFLRGSPGPSRRLMRDVDRFRDRRDLGRG